ncbi:DUF1266 domain-containing protein [Pseudomonas cremoricolorata]|uniref:DUF1266 domain-containing protein n=1 Tax=Pseudomonas cremoricolorata TaxID=157783 RepID=A0A089WTK6_9PSED|nr:DUF1266 domain-containing protein [Pseudomonas cremoricolorata]AIR89862.1 hypothetical protein LK03_11425 [Pseudomonas cremoricolorata]
MDESAQHWLHLLSAPMAALNGASLTAADYHEGEDKTDLERWWGLSNRAQLLDILNMADNGHALELADAYWQFQRCLPQQWQRRLAELPLRERIKYQYAARTFPECGPGGTRAWDLGRMSFLLRNGVKKAWITYEESLWLHYRLALRARHYYNHWDSYIAGYLFGKALWNASDCPDEQLAAELQRQGNEHWNRCIALNLRLSAQQLLADVPWDMPLPEPYRPNSLEEDCWS